MSRKGQIPSLEGAAEQVKEKMSQQGLGVVFVATDAPPQEFEEFKGRLPGYRVERFDPGREKLQRYKDGGVAIIDQIICSHAR